VAHRIAAFLDGATRTLDIAIYDLRLESGPGDIVMSSFKAAIARGVAVRLIFNADHAQTIPVPPPPEIDWAYVDQLKAIGVEVKPIPGVPDLMHHKYVVRDVGTPQAALLSGSTNWTNDSWHREENLILTVSSGDIATGFRENFDELWERPVVATSGRISIAWVALSDGTRVRPYFCPGRGLKLVHAMSRSISSARRRIRVCSPVITSGPVLGTLAEVAAQPGLDFGGVYDATQMDEVQHQWSDQPAVSWKIAAFKSIVGTARFGAKRSTPYAAGTVHDFMHAKILVADDYVYTGSFNLSHSGEENAENVLQIESHAVAELCVRYIDQVAARYGGPPAPESPAAARS
jgi:phosphatidylserine/phosphatidylglycerophosphate/cardiolipin synthase-like enzyme